MPTGRPEPGTLYYGKVEGREVVAVFVDRIHVGGTLQYTLAVPAVLSDAGSFHARAKEGIAVLPCRIIHVSTLNLKRNPLARHSYRGWSNTNLALSSPTMTPGLADMMYFIQHRRSNPELVNDLAIIDLDSDVEMLPSQRSVEDVGMEVSQRSHEDIDMSQRSLPNDPIPAADGSGEVERQEVEASQPPENEATSLQNLEWFDSLEYDDAMAERAFTVDHIPHNLHVAFADARTRRCKGARATRYMPGYAGQRRGEPLMEIVDLL